MFPIHSRWVQPLVSKGRWPVQYEKLIFFYAGDSSIGLTVLRAVQFSRMKSAWVLLCANIMLTSWLSFLGLAGQSDKTVLPVMATNCRLILTVAVNLSARQGGVQQPSPVTCALGVHAVKRTCAVWVFEYVGPQNRVTRFLGWVPPGPKSQILK